MKPVRRTGARVLLLDEHDRVLLIHERIADESEDFDHWLTPGGGVEADERLNRTAMREAYEETGLQIDLPDDSPIVHEQRRTWSWGGVTYDQTDHFFLSRVGGDPVITHPGLTAIERLTLLGVRWWSVAELRASTETLVPDDIADLVQRLISTHPGVRVP